MVLYCNLLETTGGYQSFGNTNNIKISLKVSIKNSNLCYESSQGCKGMLLYSLWLMTLREHQVEVKHFMHQLILTFVVLQNILKIQNSLRNCARLQLITEQDKMLNKQRKERKLGYFRICNLIYISYHINSLLNTNGLFQCPPKRRLYVKWCSKQ